MLVSANSWQPCLCIGPSAGRVLGILANVFRLQLSLYPVISVTGNEFCGVGKGSDIYIYIYICVCVCVCVCMRVCDRRSRLQARSAQKRGSKQIVLHASMRNVALTDFTHNSLGS